MALYIAEKGFHRMIPAFNESGVLPPFTGENPAAHTGVSPYVTQMSAVVSRFATSNERAAILLGLLDYRRELRTIGITNGFQWLDGSFVEDIELTRNRPPADIDVVTFAY